MDPIAQTVIQGLQPHSLGSQFKDSPLWLLGELAMIDRHRLLHAAVLVASGPRIGPGNYYIDHMESRTGMREPGTEVARYLVVQLDPNSPMDVDFKLAAHITFGDGPAQGREPVPVLTDLHRCVVEEIVPPLAPFVG